MSKKCAASHCITQSSRSSKISCAKCRKPFHLKCVGLSATQYKALRDFPGALWFCPACRNSSLDLEQSSINPVLNLILTRLSSILRLVGGQIDVTRTLCRAMNDIHRRSSSCLNEPRPSQLAPTIEARNFEDALNDMQFEFSNIFGSFITDAVNNSDPRVDRISSPSSNVTPPKSGRNTGVDVSVDTSDIVNITVSSIPGDASASVPVTLPPIPPMSTDALTIHNSVVIDGVSTNIDDSTSATTTATTSRSTSTAAATAATAVATTVATTTTTATATSSASFKPISLTSTNTINSIVANATTIPCPTTVTPAATVATKPALTSTTNTNCSTSAIAKRSTKNQCTQTTLQEPKPQRPANSIPQHFNKAPASLDYTPKTTTSTSIAASSQPVESYIRTTPLYQPIALAPGKYSSSSGK